MKKMYIPIFICFIFLQINCQNTESKTLKINNQSNKVSASIENSIQIDTSFQTIHVLVALCDNRYQGIVPVPKGIGNGQDPKTNLYWGCAFGVKTFFKKSQDWQYIESKYIDSTIIERAIFKHKTKDIYLIADAYNGKHIKECTVDFLKSSAGLLKDTISINGKTIGINSHAKLISYIGHDGLMDFEINEQFINEDKVTRNTIILACYSQRFFSKHLDNSFVNPLVWSTGLMSPEAYTLHDALTGFLNNEDNEAIRKRASLAYSKYQKCSEKAARNLLVTGWE